MSSSQPAVLILEAQSKASLPVIESCHRQGLRVIAAAPYRCCAGKFSRFVDTRVLSPSVAAPDDAFYKWLLGYVAAQTIDQLLPTGDPATEIVARHQDELRRHTRLVLPGYEVFRVGRDKILTLQAAQRAGVPIPKTWYPHESNAETVARAAVYPSLIKPAISAGARGIVKVADVGEFLRLLPGLEAQYGRCFLQEFVPQTGMQYKVDAVVGPQGELLTAVVYEKLRYYPPNGGSSVLNRTIDGPIIREHAARVLREIGWYGFCDFDFIEDPRDGQVKLMEINPRFPESFRATCVAGVDMVEMLLGLAHGRAVQPRLSYRTGQYLRFLPGDIMWWFTSKDRWSQWRSWCRFFGRDLDYQVCSLSDPGPIVGYLLENLFVFLDRKKRAERFRLQQARDQR